MTQTNPLPLALPHSVTNLVIKPVIQGDFLEEMPLTTTIHELLFKVTKDSEVFWVGAAVPVGSTDFSKTQVFFHPTVRQEQPQGPPIIHAKEEDYSTFSGGWSGRMQRYIGLQGGQLGALRRVPMLVPFTTMAALAPGSTRNMFSIDPVATLSHVMAAIQATLVPVPPEVLPPPDLTAVGVTSFGSARLEDTTRGRTTPSTPGHRLLTT